MLSEKSRPLSVLSRLLFVFFFPFSLLISPPTPFPVLFCGGDRPGDPLPQNKPGACRQRRCTISRGFTGWEWDPEGRYLGLAAEGQENEEGFPRVWVP